MRLTFPNQKNGTPDTTRDNKGSIHVSIIKCLKICDKIEHVMSPFAKSNCFIDHCTI